MQDQEVLPETYKGATIRYRGGGWSLFEINNFGQKTGKINNWLLFMLKIIILPSGLSEINILIQM